MMPKKQNRCTIIQHQIDKYKDKRQINGCVYRLSYGRKFIIVKAKTLVGSLITIQKALDLFDEEKAKPTMLYLHFFRHIKANPGKYFTVRVLTHPRSANHYRLLKREQTELDRGRYNPKMLNNSMEAYIPAYDEETGLYQWVDRLAVARFQRYFKSDARKKFLKELKRQHEKAAQ